VSSNRDFAVEQIFRADDFRADDPSPFQRVTLNYVAKISKEIFMYIRRYITANV
jgi:hypothetical protein